MSKKHSNEQEMVKRYLEGESAVKIAKSLGLFTTSVTRSLKRNGLKVGYKRGSEHPGGVSLNLEKKYILDACCSVKAMWINKNHPNAVYIDIRDEESGFLGYGRKESLHPDYVMDFRKMDFPDKTFKLVVFEPPHLKSLGKNSYFRKKFGCLEAETWQDDLKKGFSECWRVLDNQGVLIFKWSDNEIPFRKVLELIPHKPLFANTTNNKSTSVTKWFCFMKIEEMGV